MRFRYDPEHDELRESVRGMLADVASEAALRRHVEEGTGWSPEAWQRLCTELDVVGVAVPEECGGAGYGLVELGIVIEEAGRALLTAPILACTAAADALVLAGGSAARELLPSIVSGRSIATFAIREEGRSWGKGTRTRAFQNGKGWELTGVKEWVLHGQEADVVLVSAETATGTSLFAVETTAVGVHFAPLETIDPTRSVATLTLAGAPGILIGDEGAAPLSAVRDRFAVLLAAESTGLADHALESATGYARERTQFGRPIGSFQAIKHKLANVLLEVEAARAAVLYAEYCADNRPDELPQAAAIAGSICAQAALLAASENIQVHGGIGMTWEHTAHLYLKRATVDRVLLRDPREHLTHLAELAGIS